MYLMYPLSENNGRTCKKRRNSKIRKSHLASCQMQMQKRQKIKKRRRRNTGKYSIKGAVYSD